MEILTEKSIFFYSEVQLESISIGRAVGIDLYHQCPFVSKPRYFICKTANSHWC